MLWDLPALRGKLDAFTKSRQNQAILSIFSNLALSNAFHVHVSISLNRKTITIVWPRPRALF